MNRRSVANKEYDICRVVGCEELKKWRQLFRDLLERLAREQGIKLEECEDVDINTGLFICRKPSFAEVDLFAVQITKGLCNVCIHITIVDEDENIG